MVELGAALAARDLVPDPAVDRLADAARVPDGVRVATADCVALRVPCLDRVAALEWVGVDVAARVPVDVGDTGTHAPHVSPGNPGAPGVEDTATYPTLHVPPHATPQSEKAGGQGVQVVPDGYCPTGQGGVGEGVRAGRVCDPAGVRLREPAGVWVAAARLRCPGGGREGVFGGDCDLLGVLVPEADRMGVRVPAADRVGEAVDLGDVVGVTGTHPPHVDGVKPTAQVPK